MDGKVKRYDLKQLYHIHRVYEAKRRIQMLSKHKPRTAKRLMERRNTLGGRGMGLETSCISSPRR